MKLTKYFKSAIAGFTVVAMAVTMLPTAGLGRVEAAFADDENAAQILQEQTVKMTDIVTLDDEVSEPGTEEEYAKADADAINFLNTDDIRGNLTLASEGKYGSDIIWSSSNENIISTEAVGKVPAGVVTRPSVDTKVTLTALITYGTHTEEKTFECTVKKAVKQAETTDYLFAYFPYADTKDERIYFGISEDGLNFTALNDGKFVLESRLGTHGLRDPFVIRSHEGDKFYLIATDLTVAGIKQDGIDYPKQGWDGPNGNQQSGSKKIMVWESTDLVNWSEQRECKVSADNAGCTWAPEAYWDDETQQYMVFWASKTSDDNYGNQRVFCAMTRDFYNFSEPQVWIKEAGSVIDTTVIKVGEYYYRYTKNEEKNPNTHGTPGKRVYCERSQSLTSKEWEFVHNNSLAVGGGQIEGACIFKLNDDDVENAQAIAALKNFTLTGDSVYCLAADQTSSTVFPGLSDDITTGSFHVLGTTKGASVNGTKLYTMPEPDASHGTIMPITSEEYNNLMLKYDAAYQEAAKDYVDLANESEELLTLSSDPVSANMKLPTYDNNGAAITWESSDESIIAINGRIGTVNRPEYEKGDAEVELTATITIPGDEGEEIRVRDQIRRKSFTVKVKKKDQVKDQVIEQPDTKQDSEVTTSYTVTFDSDGGSNVASQTVKSGETAVAPQNPTKSKYLFAGWELNAKTYDFSSKVTGNITLKAKWTKVKVGTPSIKSANVKKTKCTVTAKKVTGAKGYQFAYTTDKKFKKNIKYTKPGTSLKATLNLKKGTYYVKVQAYKLDSQGKKVYGKLSKVKKVVIKKK